MKQWLKSFKNLGLVETILVLALVLPLIVKAQAFWLVLIALGISLPRLFESEESNRLAVDALDKYWELQYPSRAAQFRAIVVGGAFSIISLWWVVTSFHNFAQWVGAFSLVAIATPVIGFRAGYSFMIAPNRQSAASIFDNDGFELARSVFRKPTANYPKPPHFSVAGAVNLVLAIFSWPSACGLFVLLLITGLFISVGSFLGITIRALFIRFWTALQCIDKVPGVLVDNYFDAVVNKSLVSRAEIVTGLPEEHDLNFDLEKKVGTKGQLYLYERVLQAVFIILPTVVYRYLFKCSALIFAPIAYSFRVSGRYSSHTERVKIVHYVRKSPTSILGLISSIFACLYYFYLSVDWVAFIQDIRVVGDAPKTAGLLLYIGVNNFGMASAIVVTSAIVSIILFAWADSWWRQSEFFEPDQKHTRSYALLSYLSSRTGALHSFMALSRFSKFLGYVWLLLALFGLLAFAHVKGLMSESVSIALRPIFWLLFGISDNAAQ